MKLKVGQEAPEFTLRDQEGKVYELDQMKNKWTLLYFYPKDDTPGCTVEALAIKENFSKFEKAKLNVFGISIDSVESHKKFVEKYDLPFTLLADDKKKVVKQYGVWGKKKFMGKEFMGTNRMSFLIDTKGRIARVYDKVKPAVHADEVLTEFKKLEKA